MNKEAFIRRLRELLAGLPQSEAAEAIQYYEDYFADAGKENEAKVIEELGSPERVAANIRADLGMTGGYPEGSRNGGYAGSGEGGGYAGSGNGGYAGSGNGGYAGSRNGSYAESGEGAYSGRYNTGDRYAGNAQNDDRRYGGPDQYNNDSYDRRGSQPKKKHTALWVLLAVFTCYLWIPLIFVALILVFVAVIVVCALCLAFGVTAIALGFAGIMLIGVSLVKMFVSPAGGMVLLGGGLLITGLTIFCIWLVCMLFGRALPAFFREIGSLGRNVRRRRGDA